MLEDIRKHTGIFIVGLVLIFIGLVFLGNSRGGGLANQGRVVAEGEDFTARAKDLNKEGERVIRLAARLRDSSMRSGSYQGLIDIGGYLGNVRYRGAMDSPTEVESLAGFVLGRKILQQAIKDYGLQAGEEEIKKYVKEVLFTDQTGLFNQESYDIFVDEGLSSLGMNLSDFNEFVGEVVSFGKLSDLMGAAVQANPVAAEENAMADAQSLSVSVYSADLETFKKELSPTDEELKTYWEENKGKYLTEAKRQLSYILATPDFEAMLAKKKEDNPETTEEEEEEEEVTESAETPLPDAIAEQVEEMTEEAATEATEAVEAVEEVVEDAVEEVIPAENTPMPDISELAEAAEQAGTSVPEITLTPAERKKALDELGAEMEMIWDELQQEIEKNEKKPNLEEVLAKHKFTIKPGEMQLAPVTSFATTEMVAMSGLPPALRGPDRQDPRQTLEQKVFDAKINPSKPMDALSDPLGSGQDSWLVFHVDGSEEPKEMTFEEAKEKVRADYIEEKSREKMKEAVEKARDEIAAAIKDGKNPNEVAATLNLKTTSHENVTEAGQLPGETDTADIFRLGKQTPTGGVSKAEVLLPLENRAIFVHVTGRKFVENDANKSRISNASDTQKSMMRSQLVDHFFQSKWDEQKIEFPKPKK